MAVTAHNALVLPLESRPWDSAHFGWPVGRITESELTNSDLLRVLEQAAADGYRLLYWSTKAQRAPSELILAHYRGRLVDRKTTYSMRLDATQAEFNAAMVHSSKPPVDNADLAADGAWLVRPYAQSQPCAALEKLAIAAGMWSRFAMDPEIPPDKFTALYRIWIERSVLGELADAVLVAQLHGQSEPLGMVTISRLDNVGQIDLIAVAEGARGKGIGGLLLRGAERWMRNNDCQAARVVTQRHNEPACRLYERHGFQLSKTENYYHFWLEHDDANTDATRTWNRVA